MSDPDRAEVAAYLERQFRRARYERNLSKSDVARRMGVSTGHISHWVKGRSPIPDARLLELAVLLDFDPLEARPSLAKYRGLWRQDQLSHESLTEAILSLDEASRLALENFVRALRAAKGSTSEPAA